MRRILLAASLLFISITASAKDLSGRVAVGLDTQLSHEPALSVRLGLPNSDPLRQLQLGAAVSRTLNEDSDTPDLFIGGRAMMGLIIEDQVNVYLGTGLGGVKSDLGFTFRIQPGLTIDAFLFGLDNLGLSAGFGLDIDISEASSITTSGALLGGVHYWF